MAVASRQLHVSCSRRNPIWMLLTLAEMRAGAEVACAVETSSRRTRFEIDSINEFLITVATCTVFCWYTEYMTYRDREKERS